MSTARAIMIAIAGYAALGASEASADAWGAGSFSAPGPRTFTPGPVVRDGLFGGLSFGRGSIAVRCASCKNGGGTLTEALSLVAHVGYMLTPQVALVAEHWNVRDSQRGGPLFDDNYPHLVAQHISTIGAQMFIFSSIWVRTGIGVGWHISNGDYTKKKNPRGRVFSQLNRAQSAQTGRRNPGETSSAELTGISPAYYAAIGWEFTHNDTLAAEVQLRIARTQRPKDEYQVRNVGVNFGVSWY